MNCRGEKKTRLGAAAVEHGEVCVYRKKQNKKQTRNKNSHCSGIKLWSKYRCRVNVSLWPRTHRMGDTLQCTTNADAEEQSQHYRKHTIQRY